MRRALVMVVCGAVLVAASVAGAAEAVGEKPAPPPLPLHSIEGFGGVFITETALLVNPPVGDNVMGMPSIAFSTAQIGKKWLWGTTITANILGRGEIGYSYQRLTLGDWDNDVEAATGLSISDSAVQLHTIGARALLVREGEGDTKWVPAVTIGARYKKNTDIGDIDDDLLGTAKVLGVDDDDGVDFTLVASKTFADVIPDHPFILSAGVRSTEAIHAGFVGFSDDRDLVFEANAIVFLTKQLVLAGEYRQMPRELPRLGNLVRQEDDWWSVALAYVFNENLTVTAGFANLGQVLDEDDDFSWLAQIKWEF